jgi:hypothetical protein
MSNFQRKTRYERDVERHPRSTTAMFSNLLGENVYGGHYFNRDNLVLMVVTKRGVTLEAASAMLPTSFTRHQRVVVEDADFSRAELERAYEDIAELLSLHRVKGIVYAGPTKTVCVVIADETETQMLAQQLGLLENPMLTVHSIDWSKYIEMPDIRTGGFRWTYIDENAQLF